MGDDMTAYNVWIGNLRVLPEIIDID